MPTSGAINWREHIVSDPSICHGRPTIRGTRVLVSTILSYLARGEPTETILEEFPTVTPDAVRAVIAFAADAAIDDLPAPLPTPPAPERG